MTSSGLAVIINNASPRKYAKTDLCDGMSKQRCNAGDKTVSARYGGIAQLARACGSYPQCHWFESGYRYQAPWSSG